MPERLFSMLFLVSANWSFYLGFGGGHAMSYDTPFLLLVALASEFLFRVSQFGWRYFFRLAFAGTLQHWIFSRSSLCSSVWGGRFMEQKESGPEQAGGAYNLTLQELFYLLNLLLKYFSTIPLAVIFLMFYPSQFASSLIESDLSYGCLWKSVRPCVIFQICRRNFTPHQDVSEERVEQNYQEVPLKRVKGNLQIVIPLIFQLARANQPSRRPWSCRKQRGGLIYQQAFSKLDKLWSRGVTSLLALSFLLFVVNQGHIILGPYD